MTEDLEYINERTTSRHRGVHSGRRLKVTVLRVAVVLALVLIVAYVFDGVALFWSITEKTEAPQSTPTSPITIANSHATQIKLRCDEGWHFDRKKCYHFSKTRTSWSLSRAMCQEMGADLVKVETREEQKFLFKKIEALMEIAEEMFWVGLTDSETEGEWKWMDGSPLNESLAFWFVHGTANEPDNWTSEKHPAGEDCGRMGARAGAFEFMCWFDVPCSITSRFMCEREARSFPACQ